MISPENISNRHLLKLKGLADKPLHGAQRVRIVIGDEWARSRAGQLLASCLVNLLSRQVGLVSKIEIAAPDVDSVIALPNGEAAGRFPACLKLIARWAVEQSVAVEVADDISGEVDVTVMIGTKVPVVTGIGLLTIGNGWNAWVGRPECAPVGVVPDKRNPLGPFLAAALAAGEIFKRGRGLQRGSFLAANGYSLWSGKSSPIWAALEDGPELAGKTLRPVHLVGAGAVGNGVAYLLANAEFAEAFALCIDDDTYDGTSLNRCFLAGWEDVDNPKVDAITAVLRKAGVGAYPFPGTIRQYLTAERSGLRPDVARQADDLAFDIVLSCVDRGISRQDVQGLTPSLLLGGSTVGLAARANLYPDRAGAACLSCFNPAERDGEKIRALEKKLRGMAKEQRAAFLRDEGIDAEAVERYLESPACGSEGEAAVRDLATRAVSEFSVGFVSLGAALLLFAKLLLEMLPVPKPPRGDMTSLNFLNGGCLDSHLGADDGCEWGCGRRRAKVTT